MSTEEPTNQEEILHQLKNALTPEIPITEKITIINDATSFLNESQLIIIGNAAIAKPHASCPLIMPLSSAANMNRAKKIIPKILTKIILNDFIETNIVIVAIKAKTP